MRVDEVYIEIRHNGDFTLFEETNPGFAEVRSAVETRYKVEPNWFEAIAFEPYEQDRITLYQREKVERLRPAR